MKKNMENIGINFIIVLQILNKTEKISFSELCFKLKTNELMKNYKITGIYSILRRMEKKKLIEAHISRTIPPQKIVNISSQGKKLFSQYKNLFSGGNTEQKDVIQKEIRDLNQDEIAELSQNVFYKIIDGLDRDLEELNLKESERIRKTAEKIVKYVREY